MLEPDYRVHFSIPTTFRWNPSLHRLKLTPIRQQKSQKSGRFLGVFGAGDGNRTNTIGQNKALLPVFQFNWSQMESNPISRCKMGSVEQFMGAKRGFAVLTAIAMMFGTACSAGLWMNAIGKVSGWTGLPQYENQI